MTNEIEQLAQQNDMSIEFVTWFFNEKKANCGNVWFMMMAAMWEGWQGRSIEMDKLAAENVAMKSAITDHSHSVRFCEVCGKDDPCRTDDVCYALKDIPATDRIVAGIKADGVEEWVSSRGGRWNGTTEEALKFAKHLRDGGK